LRRILPKDSPIANRRFANVTRDKQIQVSRPACVGTEAAAAMFGWPDYYLPFLVRAGHLKPLGKPAQNARKWFATVEIERMTCDLGWLDKAIRIVEKQIQEMNKKQRGKETDVACVK
jgi:hypothetical protein